MQDAQIWLQPMFGIWPEGTQVLTQWALRILHRIFRSGVGYYKAGTTLLEIVPRTNQQFSLFDPAGDASRNDKVDGYTRCDQWAVWSRGAEVGAAAEFGKNRTLSLVGHLKRIDIQSTCRNAVNTRCGMLIRLSCELRQPAITRRSRLRFNFCRYHAR